MRRSEPREHGHSTYINHGCRCTICVGANRLYSRRARARRFAERELIDGRLVAVTAPEHGRPSTYSNYGCRCVPCTVSNRGRALGTDTTPEAGRG